MWKFCWMKNVKMLKAPLKTNNAAPANGSHKPKNSVKNWKQHFHLLVLLYWLLNIIITSSKNIADPIENRMSPSIRSLVGDFELSMIMLRKRKFHIISALSSCM